MKKYRWIVVVLLLSILIAAYATKVYKVNSNLDMPIIKEYALNEKVSFEKDFMMSSERISEGYSVQVLDSNVYSRDEFIEKYNSKGKVSDIIDCIYTVDIRIYNDNEETSEKYGISLLNIFFMSLSEYYLMDEDLTLFINPDIPGASFSLRENSSMDVTIAYSISGEYAEDIKNMDKKDYELMITAYPTRKILKLRS